MCSKNCLGTFCSYKIYWGFVLNRQYFKHHQTLYNYLASHISFFEWFLCLGTFLAACLLFLVHLLYDSQLRGWGSVRKRHLMKNQVKFLFIAELYHSAEDGASPIGAQRWTQHQDEGKFPSLCFEVQENCGTSAGSQFTLLFFPIFFLAKSTLKIQTWKQMAPRGNRTLLLYCARFLSAYPVVYVHFFFFFFKISCPQTLPEYHMTCSKEEANNKQQEGRKGFLTLLSRDGWDN